MSAASQAQSTFSTSQFEAGPWTWVSRVAFRFFVLYFGLYCLLTQIIGSLIPIPGLEIGDLGALPPFRQVVIWTAQHIFGYEQPLVFSESGSGDKVFDWIQVFCLLAIALAGACVWSIINRARTEYNSLYKWLHVFIRFALAGQMFVYGTVKVIPMQMPFPLLTRLLERFGDFSPMAVLWSSVGASPAYERFVGSAELIAGSCSLYQSRQRWGRSSASSIWSRFLLLNMTYDVPVKLLSFHLILMAMFLLLPERSRLVQFCFRDCAVGPSAIPKLFAGQRANRMATGPNISDRRQAGPI